MPFKIIEKAKDADGNISVFVRNIATYGTLIEARAARETLLTEQKQPCGYVAVQDFVWVQRGSDPVNGVRYYFVEPLPS